MYSRLLSWSRYLYLAGMVLALVLVVPTAWFPFQLLKVTVFAVFLLFALVLFAWGGGMREFIRSRGLYGALLVALLPLAYLISWFFSIDRSVALTGFGIDPDTVLFAVFLFLAFLLAFALFRTLRGVRLLLTVLFWALIAAALFQCVSIVFGSAAIPFASFADRSVNLVGKWNDLGLIVGLLVMLFLAQVELMTVSILWRVVAGVACLILAILLGIINFPLVWGLILGFSVILGTVRILSERSIQETDPPASLRETWTRRAPWFSIVAAVVSVLFLFFGSTVNTNLTTLFPVSSLEVRPSYATTLSMIDTARGNSFSRVLVGTGPNTFGEEWDLLRPSAVNQSEFWDLDFNVGFSTIITALGSVGLLGVIAWLIPLFLILAALIRVTRLGVLNREDRIVAVTLGIASLYLWCAILFYVPSQNIILLGFMLAGATFGFLWRQGQSSVEVGEESRLWQVYTAGIAVVLVVLSLWVSVASGRRLVAEAYVGKGTDVLSNGTADEAIADATRAQQFDTTGDALRLLVQADTTKLQQIAAETSTPAATLQQEFATTVEAAIVAAQKAEALNPHDYRPTLALAEVYDYLSTLNVQGASQTALTTYQAAAAQDPTNPAIPLAEARLEAAAGDQAKTTSDLSEALTLKPNYTDAILLVVQLDVANNDIQSAIRAATAAAQTAPGVGPIWFELGLLYYSAGDMSPAAQALQQAIDIVPNYANAQYFLGLADYALGNTATAIQLFQALNQSNPGNSQVELILGNLETGKPPFTGAKPPVTSTPQNSTTAPVSE